MDEAADRTAAAEPTAPARRRVLPRPRRPGLLTTLLVVVVLGLVAVSVERGLTWWHAEQRQSERDAAVAAARDGVTALITVSADSAQQDIDEMLAGLTEDFRTRFQKQSDRFTSGLRSGQVSSTGSVASAGLASLEDDTAVVLVATDGKVTNKQTTSPQPRHYRLRVTTEKVEDQWLVSNVEFVQ